MKKILSVSFFFSLLINSLHGQIDASLKFPSNLSVSPGVVIEIPLLVTTDSLISSVLITLDYDSTKVIFLGASAGASFPGATVTGNGSPAFPPTTTGTNKNAQAEIFAEPSNPVTGAEVEMITLRWQVSGYNGNALIQFEPAEARTFLATVHGKIISQEKLDAGDGVITIVPDTTAILSLVTDTTDVLENTPFAVTLAVSQVADLHQFISTISFDPTIIRVDSVRPGDFLTNSGLSAITWTPPVLDNTSGLISGIQATRADTFGVHGSGSLARLYFRSLMPGVSSLQFVTTESALRDPEANAIPVASFAGTDMNIYREPVAELALPDTFAAQNRYIDLPITITGVGDVDIISALIEVGFDTACMKGVSVVSQNTLTEGWQTPVVNLRSESMYFALAGASPLAGDGILVYLRFYTNPGAEENDQCELRFIDVLLNEGDPTTIIHAGSFRVRGLQIAGSIDYEGTGLPVPFVGFSLTGHQLLTHQTDENGNFNFTRLHYGNYVLTPEKIGDQGRAISPFDAALVLQHVVGSSQLSPYQKIAADVTGDSTVSSFDASYIMRLSVDLEEKFPVMDTADAFWEFVPAAFAIDETNWFAHPDTIVYNPLEKDEFNQNFIGIIYGDVSQNWTSPSLQSVRAQLPPMLAGMSAGAIRPTGMNSFAMPIILESSQAIHSIELEISYPAELMVVSRVSQTDGSGPSLISYSVGNALLKIALASAEPMTQQGEVIAVHFQMKAGQTEGWDGAIRIESAKLNDVPVPLVTGATDTREAMIPTRLSLEQNYPNPFNQETVFKVDVPLLSSGEEVALKIYNLTGQLVRTLLSGESQPGTRLVHWSGNDEGQRPVSSGEYLAVLTAGRQRIVQKFILLR
ncbi:MAG: FlgD immunoglobulin-like domain containing protein [Candidatus Zhuqueibacterota bacterium]